MASHWTHASLTKIQYVHFRRGTTGSQVPTKRTDVKHRQIQTDTGAKPLRDGMNGF